jgi:hypothetical protein
MILKSITFASNEMKLPYTKREEISGSMYSTKNIINNLKWAVDKVENKDFSNQ